MMRPRLGAMAQKVELRFLRLWLGGAAPVPVPGENVTWTARGTKNSTNAPSTLVSNPSLKDLRRCLVGYERANKPTRGCSHPSVVADDHSVVRGLVRSALQQLPHFEVCGEPRMEWKHSKRLSV